MLRFDLAEKRLELASLGLLRLHALDYNMDIVFIPQVNINQFDVSFALGGVDLRKGLETVLLKLGMDLVLSSSGKTTLYHTNFPN